MRPARKFADSLPLRKIVATWLQPGGLVWRRPRHGWGLEASVGLTPCALLECGHRRANLGGAKKKMRCNLCGPRTEVAA